MFPCFLGGFLSRLVSKVASAAISFARVWRGSILPQRQEVLLNADPHAPAKFRAIGAPSNMPAFAEAFQCKAGDAMVREGDKQVKIW